MPTNYPRLPEVPSRSEGQTVAQYGHRLTLWALEHNLVETLGDWQLDVFLSASTTWARAGFPDTQVAGQLVDLRRRALQAQIRRQRASAEAQKSPVKAPTQSPAAGGLGVRPKAPVPSLPPTMDPF